MTVIISTIITNNNYSTFTLKIPFKDSRNSWSTFSYRKWYVHPHLRTTALHHTCVSVMMDCTRMNWKLVFEIERIFSRVSSRLRDMHGVRFMPHFQCYVCCLLCLVLIRPPLFDL